jgi:hypothetical protein
VNNPTVNVMGRSGSNGARRDAWILAAFFLCGCNSGAPVRSAECEGLERDIRVVHEECDTSGGGAEKLDANADGRADVVIVRSGGREVCRAVDLNLDGTVDVYSYNDSAGRLRRREYDFDRDGVIDDISTYQAGVITSRQRATLLANRLDTWDFYQNGTLARRERDSDSDAVVDTWWEYPRPGCPMIHTDANEDGRPDPGTTIDYCKETGYVPPERQYYRQTEGPSFRDETSAPTEVENREEGEAPKPEPPKQEKK